MSCLVMEPVGKQQEGFDRRQKKKLKASGEMAHLEWQGPTQTGSTMTGAGPPAFPLGERIKVS